MYLSKSTYFVLAVVVFVMTLSITVFRKDSANAMSQQQIRPNPQQAYEDKRERYPVAEYDEKEPADPAKRIKLRLQKRGTIRTHHLPTLVHRMKSSRSGQKPNSICPISPVTKSDVIVVAEVLEAKAHRSENKMNVSRKRLS